MLAQQNDAPINKAVFILKKMSADDRMREAARIREKALHDEASYLADARAEGMAQGKAEGIDSVLEAMRNAGIDEETIGRITGSLKN